MPIILDAFCGEGSAARGYARAGFEVVGIDNDPVRLENYPYDYIAGDAIEYIYRHGSEYDAIHTSPTCTGYSRGTAAIPDRIGRYDRLIGAAREAALSTDVPFIIENVADARNELRNPVSLCWTMFREPGSVTDSDGTPLQMFRHRLFETSFPLAAPSSCLHIRDIQVAGAYGGARRDKEEARYVRKGGYVPPSLSVLSDLIGVPNGELTEKGLFLAIPPEYTEWVGYALMEYLINNE